ncbi:MAG: methionine adenosyltransferase domain-containing protein, partial [Chloroflexota bacterium]
VADAYGPRVPIGGGAWSGKDWFKVDRAGGIIARRIALAAVRAGASREATVELLWRPGDREASVVALTGAGGERLDPAPHVAGIDCTLRGNGDRWPRLIAGGMARLAVEGHFGNGQSWEA